MPSSRPDERFHPSLLQVLCPCNNLFHFHHNKATMGRRNSRRRLIRVYRSQVRSVQYSQYGTSTLKGLLLQYRFRFDEIIFQVKHLAQVLTKHQRNIRRLYLVPVPQW